MSKVASLGDYIREQRLHAQVSLRQLAKSAGVSNPYLSQVERGLKKPSAEILQQIAKGLRISAETLYVRAGILEDRGTASDVAGAVLADPGLDERQKRVLLDVYDSFRRENDARATEALPGAPRKTARSAAKRSAAKKPAATKPAPKPATPKPATPKTTTKQTTTTAARKAATRRNP